MTLRKLTPFEVTEARLIFGDGLDYARARVFEGARFPNLIAKIGAALQRQKFEGDNAVTLGNVSCFPVTLRTSAQAMANGDLTHFTWLMHELTHQWQYQHMGWRYLFLALGVQLREGMQSYNYQKKFPSREEALRAARKEGRELRDFNLEQQGDLARDYYFALKRGQDRTPWEPFVEEFRRVRKVGKEESKQ
jgi:hypothetical protein